MNTDTNTNIEENLVRLLDACLKASGRGNGSLFIQVHRYYGQDEKVDYHFCAQQFAVKAQSHRELMVRVTERKGDKGALFVFAEKLGKLDVPLLDDQGKERELRSALEDLQRKVSP